jgi:F0F1-type ATP synthase membrane subunit b/b'
MTWLQLLAQAGIMATFLGAGLALAAYFNGKHIKAGVREIKNGLAEIKSGLTEVEKVATQRHEEVMKVAEQRHEEVIRWMKEAEERAEKRHQEVLQQHQDIVNLLKYGFGVGERKE